MKDLNEEDVKTINKKIEQEGYREITYSKKDKSFKIFFNNNIVFNVPKEKISEISVWKF